MDWLYLYALGAIAFSLNVDQGDEWNKVTAAVFWPFFVIFCIAISAYEQVKRFKN